jgi:hypothetical protein
MNNVLLVEHTVAIVYTAVPPWELLLEGTGNGYHSLQYVDGEPLGRYCWRVWQGPPPKLKKTSMVAPWRVLPVGLAAATTKVEEYVVGGPLGGAAGGSSSDHYKS